MTSLPHALPQMLPGYMHSLINGEYVGTKIMTTSLSIL